MNTKGIVLVLAIGCGVLSAPPDYGLASDEGEGTAESSPIKLVDAVQGPCKKGELSTERGCVVPPHIKKRVQPRFPRSATPGKDLGKVTLGATVETDGSVGPVEVINSTSLGHGFEESAIAAVQKWRYKPGELGGVPVRIYFTVTIEFTYR
jgi:protein TonB